MPERTYTTHDIARYCDVYPSSVVRWINEGKLKSYETPGGHQRVSRENLLVFLKEFRIPIPPEVESPQKRILIVDDDVEITRVLERAFARYPDEFKTEVCHSGVEALIRIGQEVPDLIVLDIVLPKMDGLQVCKVLKAKPATRALKIVVISGNIRSLNLELIRTKNGKLMLVKYLVKGQKAAKGSKSAKGYQYVILFVLKKSVYLPARPYMRPSYAAMKPKIDANIKAAIAEAIAGKAA